MLGDKLESFTVFRNLGVLVMQLSYNRKSPFAAGVMEPEAGGLTPLGREAVAEMERLGIAIDLSHANAATTSDVLAVCAKPPIMTHTGAAVVHAHPRTKSDAQLRALAAKGGVVGIFDLPYLTASPRQPTVTDYMQHLTCWAREVRITSASAMMWASGPSDTSTPWRGVPNPTDARRRLAARGGPADLRRGGRHALRVSGLLPISCWRVFPPGDREAGQQLRARICRSLTA
jgi:hypothetical protein